MFYPPVHPIRSVIPQLITGDNESKHRRLRTPLLTAVSAVQLSTVCHHLALDAQMRRREA